MTACASPTALPWFWSNQKGLRLQIAGPSTGHDHVLEIGEPASGRFSLLAFRHGRLTAVESVNHPADHMAARRLLAAGVALSPSQAAAPGFDLKPFTTGTTEPTT
ncbi:oxidoreductase C-terminal domain-containing protein [Streptomyces sp. NPDC006355]|uniref:oxidoreductase C-terminal domain-containing protein n=1 Tax=Streptomyces sp. NPDC006355 TaxID=3156758 RepID=UPI0033B77D5F